MAIISKIALQRQATKNEKACQSSLVLKILKNLIDREYAILDCLQKSVYLLLIIKK